MNGWMVVDRLCVNLRPDRLQVAALREAGGAGGPDEQRLLAMMTDEDFDPDAYDAAMASAFDCDYYKVQIHLHCI